MALVFNLLVASVCLKGGVRGATARLWRSGNNLQESGLSTTGSGMELKL